jgi:hypothetical protein
MGAIQSIERERPLLSVKAWRETSSDYVQRFEFPEYGHPDLSSKPNTAVCFSGGKLFNHVYNSRQYCIIKSTRNIYIIDLNSFIYDIIMLFSEDDI